MGLDAAALHSGLDALAAIEPGFAQALGEAGYPEPRERERGYAALLRTIVGQQVSFHAANAVWNRMETALGPGCPPQRLIEAEADMLRTCGLSRQKQGYARSLAELYGAGDIDFDALPADDEAAIALLTRIKGIGRWTAEIYLLFAEGRPDIWPAGDLAVQEDVRRIMGLPSRPSERETRAIGERWRPHRSAAAIFAWHHYKVGVI